MKYLSIVGLVVCFSFLSNQSFAKTEGSYLSAEVLRSHLRFQERYKNTPNPNGVLKRPAHVGNDNFGGGVTYKYAFNFKGLFLAPGIFYERHDARLKGETSVSRLDWQNIRIKNRYGLKADAGIDIGGFAPYVTGGLATISYRTMNYNQDYEASAGILNDSINDFFYGAGFKFAIPRTKVSINFEYNANKFFAKTATNPSSNANNFEAEYKTRFEIFKLGMAVNF